MNISRSSQTLLNSVFVNGWNRDKNLFMQFAVSYLRPWFTYHFVLTDHCTALHDNAVVSCVCGYVRVCVCANAATFKREQRPLQRAERCSLISGIDLLEEAVGVMAPQGACKAVDARRQLSTYTYTVQSITRIKITLDQWSHSTTGIWGHSGEHRKYMTNVSAQQVYMSADYTFNVNWLTASYTDANKKALPHNTLT